LACDGIWDCVTNQEACDFVSTRLDTIITIIIITMSSLSSPCHHYHHHVIIISNTIIIIIIIIIINNNISNNTFSLIPIIIIFIITTNRLDMGMSVVDISKDMLNHCLSEDPRRTAGRSYCICCTIVVKL
jgi:hypothetical protein